MAVYTKITKNELNTLLKNYNIGSVSNLEGITAGVENTNYCLVTTTNQKYIFTIYEKRVSEKDLPYYLKLTKHLNKNDILCPKPIYNNDNSLISYIKNKPCAIVTFLEGKNIFNIEDRHIKELGEYIAKMHLKGQNFNMEKENSISLKNWILLFDELKEKIKSIEENLDTKIETCLNFLKKNWPQDLPSGVIHGDIFPDNVLFENNKISGIIDFYFTCNDFLIYDLAICINSWCFENECQLNKKKVNLLISSYNKVRNISEKELESLHILCLGSALRFFLTRFYDYAYYHNTQAEVNLHDYMEYLLKFKFHSNISSYKEYGL